MKAPHGLVEITAAFGHPTVRGFERANIVSFELPYPLIYGTAMVRKSRAHKLVVPHFIEALQAVKDQGLTESATHYAGIYQQRAIRGMPTHLSTHSWGIAIDLNPDENRLGTAGHMDPRIIAVFEAAGFTWGGNFPRLDPMHFQYASGY